MANGIQINNLTEATSLNDTDHMTIVQDDENKKMPISLLDKDGSYSQSVINTIPDLITTSKSNVETIKQAIDEKFGEDEFSAQINTVQEMSNIGISDDGSIDVSPQVQDGFMETATLYGRTQYHDKNSDTYYDLMPEDTTGIDLELVSVKYITHEDGSKLPILTTIGKNLFDESKKNEGYIERNSTNETLSTDVANTWTTNWIKVKSNTSYTMQGGNRNRWQLKSSNGTITYIDSQTITTLSDTEFVRCYYCNETYTASNVQLVEGSVATSYEPYKTSILFTENDLIMRSNGSTRDSLDLITGKFIQRIDEDNNILTTPIETTIDINTDFGDEKLPIVYKGGHILLESDELTPELQYSIPISYSGLIAQNTMTNLKHSWRLDELELMAYASIVNSQYDSLMLVVAAELSDVEISKVYSPDESLYQMLKVLVNANALQNADEKIAVFYLYGKLSDEMYLDLII